jgi:hypothetical protein
MSKFTRCSVSQPSPRRTGPAASGAPASGVGCSAMLGGGVIKETRHEVASEITPSMTVHTMAITDRNVVEVLRRHGESNSTSLAAPCDVVCSTSRQ